MYDIMSQTNNFLFSIGYPAMQFLFFNDFSEPALYRDLQQRGLNLFSCHGDALKITKKLWENSCGRGLNDLLMYRTNTSAEI